MAYALNCLNNGYVSVPTITGGIGAGRICRFDLEVTDISSTNPLFGNANTSASSNDTFRLMSPTQVQIRVGGQTTAVITIASGSIPLNTRIVLEVFKTSAPAIEVRVNGSAIGSASISTFVLNEPFSINYLFAGGTNSRFRGKVYEADVLGNSFLNTDQPTATTWGTGTLVGFPTDGTQWTAYGGGTAPTGTVTIGTITPNSTGASAPFTYSAADQTGFEYQLNETGTIYPISASPATPIGLTPSTAYTIRVRSVNASGMGAWSTSAPFTTSGVVVSFVGGPIPDQVATVGVFFSLNVAAYFTGTLTPLAYDFSFGSVTGTGLSLNASTGMLEGTPTSTGDLDLQFRATDTGTNTAVSNLISLLINPASDVTPPTFTVAPAVSSITQTGGTATATINETGSIFYVIVPQAQATPSGPQVIAGQNASGTAPIDNGSAVNTTTLSDPFTGITAGQPYKACYIARDDEPTPNVQASVTVVNFNAAAAPVGTITSQPLTRNMGTASGVVSLSHIDVRLQSTGALTVRKTSVSTNGSSVFTFSDAAITTGSTYIVSWLESGGEFGIAYNVVAS